MRELNRQSVSVYEVVSLNSDDIAEWPANLHNFQIEKIVFKGPTRANHYPKSSVGRSFNETNFQRHTANGALVDKTWLVYSLKLDRVFCFCCKTFSGGEFSLAGTNDSEHMPLILKIHERSAEHFDCYEKWAELIYGFLVVKLLILCRTNYT